MTEKLERFTADLWAGQASRASLFWLRCFIQHAQAGVLRSDVWVDTGLREGAEVLGLDPTDLSPRLALFEDYALFQAERLKDQQIFSGEALTSLDWNRKYNLSLASDVTEASVSDQIEQLWSELGGVSPEAEALEKLLTEQTTTWGHNLPDRSRLPEILHEAQNIYGGWLPREVMAHIAHSLKLPLADVYGVTEFFTMFYTEPIGKKIIRVCEDAACSMGGSHAVEEALCHHLQVEPNQMTADGEYTIEPIRCLGLCDHAPAALVNETRHYNISTDSLDSLLNNEPRNEQVENKIGGVAKVALANVNVVDPESLDDYRSQGGVAAFRKVLTQMTPETVISTIKESGLVGRGGAAFPTGLKWEFTAGNPPGPRHVICNADESEVGAFKDRVLMDNDPFRVLEGLMIACYAVGAEQGFIYIRGEHHEIYRRFVRAVKALEEAGWLGENIQNSGFTCHIGVRRGAGAYICGEETALMEALEGKRGFPRLRPPFPTTHGLWGRPTVINNVETFAKVPAIILHGGAWYHSLGTQDSAGTKLFAVSGSVKRPGVYEVAFGMPLRFLIEDLAGGVIEGRKLRGILTGGAAGTFLQPEHLDTIISFEAFKEVGGTIGAGTIIVFDDTVNPVEVVTTVGEFFSHESCGKCYPCQIGTQRQAEILNRIQKGQGRTGDVDTILELAQVMTDTSICGLGQSAGWAATDAIKRWPEFFENGK